MWRKTCTGSNCHCGGMDLSGMVVVGWCFEVRGDTSDLQLLASGQGVVFV